MIHLEHYHTGDTYIAKDSAINEEIDKLRLSATASLIDRICETDADKKHGNRHPLTTLSE